VTVYLGGKHREIKYRFSAWAKMEQEYGSIQNVMGIIKDNPFSKLPEFLAIGLSTKDEAITADQVFEWLDELDGINNMYSILEKMKKAISGSVPQATGAPVPQKAKK